MPDTFHSAAPDELEGLALARFVSRLGVETDQPGTFLWDGKGDLSAAWGAWLEHWFTPVLAPAIVAVHRLEGEVRSAEIAEIDRALDLSLTESPRRRSLAAAKPFLEGKSDMQANREWIRYAGLVAGGEAPGHATILFALQTRLYHLPLAPSLSAYAWFELESGLPRTGFRDREGSADEVLGNFAAAIPRVRVAMGGDQDEPAGDRPHLRAI